MSYYILPRIETQISIMPSLFCSKDTIKPYISHSLVKYMKESILSDIFRQYGYQIK